MYFKSLMILFKKNARNIADIIEFSVMFAAEDIVGKNYSSDDEEDGEEADEESSDSEAEPARKKKKSIPPAPEPPEASPPMNSREVISETQKQYTEILQKKNKSNNKRYK